jgi:hypothetical protein
VANGDLFSHIIAFSPGFMRPPAQVREQREAHRRRGAGLIMAGFFVTEEIAGAAVCMVNGLTFCGLLY